MHFGQHTTDRAPCRRLDVANIGNGQPAVGLESGSLVVRERFRGLLRQRDDASAVGGAKLEHVTGKRLELREVELDDLASGRLQASNDVRALLGVGNRVGTDDGYVFADVHQDVRVVNRMTVSVDGVERNDVVVELLREIAERIEMRA